MTVEGVIVEGGIPDFSGRLRFDELYKVLDRFERVLSGDQAFLGRVVVFTRQVQNPQTGQPETGEFTVDLTSLGSEEEDTDVVYCRNVQEAMRKLQSDWLRARYGASGDGLSRNGLINCEERFNREMNRLAQLKWPNTSR